MKKKLMGLKLVSKENSKRLTNFTKKMNRKEDLHTLTEQDLLTGMFTCKFHQLICDGR